VSPSHADRLIQDACFEDARFENTDAHLERTDVDLKINDVFMMTSKDDVAPDRPRSVQRSTGRIPRGERAGTLGPASLGPASLGPAAALMSLSAEGDGAPLQNMG
jgi:hypothetical protein